MGISALFVMFTTLLTILDGFPRLAATGIAVIRFETLNQVPAIEKSMLLCGCTLVLVIGAAWVLLSLMGFFQTFIDFVTITAFVVSPITAILNHFVMFSSSVPAEFRPAIILKTWGLISIVVLSSLSALFMFVRLF